MKGKWTMSSVMFKNDPLAEQWAQRNNAQGIRLTPITGDDYAYANGLMTEFDEVLDYTTRQSKPDNAWEADGKAANAEANLIAAACSDDLRGRTAEQRLIALGYTVNGAFDDIRRKTLNF